MLRIKDQVSAFRIGELRRFQGGGKTYVYLAPSGAIFESTALVSEILDELTEGKATKEELCTKMRARGWDTPEVEEAFEELHQCRAIANGKGFPKPEPAQKAPLPFPLQTLVLNVTNQCNLSCKYCYEFGEDRVATPEGKPKFMSEATAHSAVDYLIDHSPGRRTVHLTFFGGESLMNLPLIRDAIEYARRRAHAADKSMTFSLTTNGTLLRPEVIEYLVENEVGVTVSLDGPPQMNDAQRVFSNGRGSYDTVEPGVRALLERQPSRPVAARVTLTSQVTDVLEIYRHLKHEVGFYEVGFAPVTTSPLRRYAIGEEGLNSILGQFRELAQEYLEFALRGEHHGFSNVSDTLAELHTGVSKAYPCGAGLGLLGVGPSGDIVPCHRFADSDAHRLGHVGAGIDHDKQAEFLERGHIAHKRDCHTCWTRPVCSGGCYHEAHVRYNDTGHPNLHYCDWIRGWIDVCLGVYGEIAAGNPAFLKHFEDRKKQ